MHNIQALNLGEMTESRAACSYCTCALDSPVPPQHPKYQAIIVRYTTAHELVFGHLLPAHAGVRPKKYSQLCCTPGPNFRPITARQHLLAGTGNAHVHDMGDVRPRLNPGPTSR